MNNLQPIYPSEGMVLTNGIIYSDSVIYLSVNDKADNYWEITKEEYENLKSSSEMMDYLTPNFENDKLKEEI